ncbi:MAG: hypothetical protein HOL66_04155 [Rhodospirillaceae bacterium]|jgi:hypothetical protein|nr:hypothetical protein [Rhodospirillaceae bacterium]MBT5243416.1 hypothetical protein [Rhodospirillaceae bacterium]MBT5563421.1 hypothetical protein [Rhodospirillaceae bacterium]MBT6241096.1 hypothetical protein [Rhodospirillaceae bacterium]MBT7137627.1 hypothetical protein [Rhodospirillaceae bacterium]
MTIKKQLICLALCSFFAGAALPLWQINQAHAQQVPLIQIAQSDEQETPPAEEELGEDDC